MLDRLFIRKAFKDKGYQRHLNDLNMSRTKLFSRIIMALEVMMLSLSYLTPHMFQVDSLAEYRFYFASLLVCAALFQVVSLYYQKHAKQFAKRYQVFIGLLVLFGLIWGASITQMDLSQKGTMSVYLTFVFMLSIVIIQRPDYFLIQFLTAHLYFIFGLETHGRMIEIVLNSSVFIIFAWIVTRMRYEREYGKFISDQLIKDKNRILEERNRDLVRLAKMDYLTGLYNRHSLDHILDKLWSECYIHQKPMAILMVDIDAFKRFNDTYGHIMGDKCIVEVSALLRATAEAAGGFAFRYGGDEFCILLTGTLDIQEFIQELEKKVAKRVLLIDQKEVVISLSIGKWQGIPSQDDKGWQSIDAADKSLYEIKAHRKRRADDKTR